MCNHYAAADVASGLAATVIWYTWVCLLCNYPLLCSAFRHPLISPQCTTGCWCCDISHPPCHEAWVTVQLVTVSNCPVSPSLYSRWLRLSRLSQVIVIRLVPDSKWLPRIPGYLIVIKCWSRQAVMICLLKDHIIDSQVKCGKWCVLVMNGVMSCHSMWESVLGDLFYHFISAFLLSCLLACTVLFSTM